MKRLVLWIGLLGWTYSGWSLDIALTPDAGKGRVVYRANDVWLQYVDLRPQAALRRDWAGWAEHGTLTEAVLLHTNVETGRVLPIMKTETGREWRTRAGSMWHSRVIGLAADEARIYGAHWGIRVRGRGLNLTQPNEPGQPPISGAYSLLVFARADGKLLHLAAVPGGPNGLPAVSLEKGPLKRVSGGVDCHGTQVRFNGLQVLK